MMMRSLSKRWRMLLAVATFCGITTKTSIVVIVEAKQSSVGSTFVPKTTSSLPNKKQQTTKSRHHETSVAATSSIVPRGGLTTPNDFFNLFKATASFVVGEDDAKRDSFKKTSSTTTTSATIKKTTTTTSGASIPNEVFNLVKAIVGVGVLSLPAGIAAFGNAPSAVLPAASLIAIIGILSGFGFSLIGRVCAYTGATSYREAWSKSVGPGSSWIPAWSCTTKTLLACLAFSMVLADTFSALLGGQERNPTLIGVTVLLLLPLCLLKNLKSLAPFSLVGVLGMSYTALAMTIRYFDKTYEMPDGRLVTQVASQFQPSFGTKGASAVFSSSSLILVCMLSTAYMAHFNAPKFYLELKDNTMPRYNTVVGWSFGISIVLMSVMAMLGFLTFGSSCSGLVLNNYATSDTWMSGSRIAVAISLLFSYPLAFTGCRDGFLDLLEIPSEKRSSALLNFLTVSLLSVITIAACTLKDVSFVLAFGGATLGNAITYVYPALMYRATVLQQGRYSDEKGWVNLSLASAVLGIVMGAIGAKMAVQNAGGH